MTKYYLMENCLFDCLYSLIMHYRQNVLRSSVNYLKKLNKIYFFNYFYFDRNFQLH